MLREVAADSETYSVFWTVNRLVSVTYVAAGELVATFEPANLEGMTPRSGREWLARFTVTEEQWRRDWWSAALAIAAEELSGVRVDGQWLEQEHLGVQL